MPSCTPFHHRPETRPATFNCAGGSETQLAACMIMYRGGHKSGTIFCICINVFNRPRVLVRCCVDIDLQGRLALTGKQACLPASAKDIAANRTARPAATRSPSRRLASNRSGPANPCARRPPGARASPSRQTHRTRQVTWMALTWSVRKFKRQGV